MTPNKYLQKKETLTLKRTRCHEKESIQEWKLLKHSKEAKETRFILSCYCRNCWFKQSGNNAANRQVCFWEKEGVLNFIQKWPSGYWQISHGVQKHGGGAGRELSESGVGGILRRWRAFAPGFWWEMQSPGSVFTFHSPSTIRTCSSGQPSIRAAKPERATLWVEGWGSEPGAISLSPLEKSRKLETGFSHACVTHLTWLKQQTAAARGVGPEHVTVHPINQIWNPRLSRTPLPPHRTPWIKPSESPCRVLVDCFSPWMPKPAPTWSLCPYWPSPASTLSKHQNQFSNWLDLQLQV